MTNPYALNLSKFSTHNKILRNIGENKAVLDIGCNEGYLGISSSKSNVFYGLDYMENTVKKAKKRYKDAIVYDLNNLRNLPWKQKFDVIVFADVLEHVLYPDKVLQYFSDHYLKDDGTIILSLPNIANWQVRLKLLSGNFDSTETGIMDKTHLHLYTYRKAGKLAKAANLKISKTMAGASIFGPIIYLLPFAKGLLATNIILVLSKA